MYHSNKEFIHCNTTQVFCLTDDSDEIQMLLGGFAYDAHHYKMVGPFLADKGEPAPTDFKTLFEALTAQQPDGTHFNFSFDVSDSYNNSLMKIIDAHYTFTDYYLSTDHTIETSDEAQRHIIKYHKAFYSHFDRLHRKIFQKRCDDSFRNYTVY